MYKNIAPRRPSDDYQTPLRLAQAICKRLSEVIPPPKEVIEPSAGIGHFVVAARECWPDASITAVELREACKGQLEGRGANRVIFDTWESVNLEKVPIPELIVGNPPYELALSHLELALKRVKPGGHVALLLRMAFLNSQERVRELWDKKKGFRYLLPLAQRPSFTGDGKSEHSEYACYVWEPGYKGNAEILPHLWVE
jgi:hypothetical protein